MADTAINYYAKGGALGECTNCGREGRLRSFPGSPRDRICERCRRHDEWYVGAFVVFMYLIVPIVVVLGLVFGWFA